MFGKKHHVRKVRRKAAKKVPRKAVRKGHKQRGPSGKSKISKVRKLIRLAGRK